MQEPTTKSQAQNESKNEPAEWVTPTIADYEIEEVTLSGPWFSGAHLDATNQYS